MPPHPASSRLRPLVLVRQVFVGYVFAMLVLFLMQRSYFYQPSPMSAEQFQRQVQSLSNGRVTVIEPFQAVVIEPESGPIRGTALLFHGNAGTAMDRRSLASVFLPRGLRLVLAEYPGYGSRGGRPSEQALVADAIALASTLQARYPQQPLVVVGESLGTGVAVQVTAAAGKPPAALVLLTPFLSMVQVVADSAPYVPARLLVQDRFESHTHILRYSGPVHVLVAENDELVTAKAGEALFEIARARGPAVLVRIPEAGHNDWRYAVAAKDWDALLGAAGPN